MQNLLQTFKEKVLSNFFSISDNIEEKKEDYTKEIAFGVLLLTVAESDEKFLPEEEAEIKAILNSKAGIDKSSLALVLSSIHEAQKNRIDLFTFTNEVKENLPYEGRIEIIENLFSVACADGELSFGEIETIRKISNLLYVSQRDFVNAKVKIKKEFNLEAIEL